MNIGEKIPCKSMFSNGTEYMLFLETQCFKCTRYRNGHCRIYNRTQEAMFLGEKVFPFSDLSEWRGLGGKTCNSFTDEPIPRKPRVRKPLKGQMVIE